MQLPDDSNLTFRLQGLHGGSLIVVSVACLVGPCDLVFPLLAFVDQLLLICGTFVTFKAFLSLPGLTDPSKPEYCLGIVMYFSIFLLLLSWLLFTLFLLAIPTVRCIICIKTGRNKGVEPVIVDTAKDEEVQV